MNIAFGYDRRLRAVQPDEHKSPEAASSEECSRRDSERHSTDLCAQVQYVISCANYRPIRSLTCSVDGETKKIIVVGQVPSFFIKQQAQELLRRCFCETPFVNRIEVVS